MIPTASRNSRLIFLVCMISLAVLWSCRLPRLCIFDQCPQCPENDVGFATARVSTVSSVSSEVAIDLSAPDAAFVSWPLARVCTETTRWTPGLVFICDNNSGGIGNVRNFILTCVRYAIEAGATGITMPTIQTRSQDRLADLFVGKKLPLSYFFDEQHFRTSLRGACPQMTIFDTVEDVPGLRVDERGVQRPEMITPNHFGLRGGCDQRDLNRHADLFGSRFRAWLGERQEKFGLPAVGVANPRLIRFNWGVQWTYPVWRDGPEFVATFGGLLRFRADVLELGREAVAAVRRRASGAADFVGIHLRTENDALGDWPDFEAQSGAYLARTSTISAGASATGPRFAYLATGNETEAGKLASRAWEGQQLRVLTKHELLADEKLGEGDLLERLNGLSWDQQALVDFVVLLAADYFLGVSPSSFSMNVALKRHLRGEGVYTRPWRVGREEGDGRSWLVGRYEGYWDDWLFMYESLWP